VGSSMIASMISIIIAYSNLVVSSVNSWSEHPYSCLVQENSLSGQMKKNVLFTLLLSIKLE